MKALLREITPPVLLRALRRFRGAGQAAGTSARSPDAQELDVYSTEAMASLLETWGEGTAWHEIALLLAARRGRVLDIACGTGLVMERLGRRRALELHGCDISGLLLGKALARGIPPPRLTRADATALPYGADAFDYAYTIGSLEHFTEEGVAHLLAECDRVTRGLSFHMIPVSRSGRDEGWVRRAQSYHNNGTEWWRARFARAAREVGVLPSLWEDGISVGRWFVCRHGEEAGC